MIKVVVVDDHAFVRECLGELFAATADIRVVAECADGHQVVAAALRTDPDVVLMDIAMPGMTGLEAARRLLAVRPGTRIVLLSGTVTVPTVCEARAIGVCGYLLKEDDPDELPALVRAAAAGDLVWSPVATARLAGCA